MNLLVARRLHVKGSVRILFVPPFLPCFGDGSIFFKPKILQSLGFAGLMLGKSKTYSPNGGLIL